MILLMLSPKAQAQDYISTPTGIKARIRTVDVSLQFYSPQILRVTKTPAGKEAENPSISVVMSPQQTKISSSHDNGVVTIASDSLTVKFDLKTGKTSYFRPAGIKLLEEKEYGAQFMPATYADNNTFEVSQAFLLDDDEPIYGLGQHQTGRMNQRNQKLSLQQENTVTSIPFMQSPKGYAVYWDNASRSTFKDNPMETSFVSEAGNCVDYYFLVGGNADDVTRQMRTLTGNAPMNALWTYGYWQSKERYKSQDELIDVVKRYRELGVPIDGIVQDWQYWGTDTKDWNALCFNNPLFPDPKGMIDEVHRLNTHIAISIWPSFGTQTDVYREMEQKGLLLTFDVWPEDSKIYDAFNAEARDLYWDYLNRNIFSLGMDAWWMDASEPRYLINDNSKFQELLNQPMATGQYRTVANAYPLATVGGVYEHQRLANPGKRVYIFTRSGFAGQQRYGSNSWSGDILSRWSVLRDQIPAGLNFSVCGIPYWNADIGGFTSIKDYPEGVNDPAFHELYVRWLQYGAFTPMMRSHGTNTPREIYQFGSRGTWAFDAIERYIRLRYRLLPYIYSTAWHVTSAGGSFLRPLFMDYPTDTEALDINDQFVFGQSILVAPVTEPMYVDKDTKTADFSHTGHRSVYLPSGNSWYDFWTGERHEGGKAIRRDTPIDIMPLYIKSGSILPIGPDVQYATEKNWDGIELRIYPGADGSFTLYEDENDNYNYEKGLYSTIDFNWNDANRTLTIGNRKGQFPGMLKSRKFRIAIVSDNNGAGDEASKKARTVKYSGKEISIKL